MLNADWTRRKTRIFYLHKTIIAVVTILPVGREARSNLSLTISGSDGLIGYVKYFPFNPHCGLLENTWHGINTVTAVIMMQERWNLIHLMAGMVNNTIKLVFLRYKTEFVKTEFVKTWIVIGRGQGWAGGRLHSDRTN